MKGKRKLIFSAIIILLIMIGLLIAFKNRTKHYIDQANNNLEMGEIKLLGKEEDMQEILKQRFKIIPGWFGCDAYSNEKDEIEIRFSAFPDYSSGKGGITYIETKNPTYSFYDIHVGDGLDKPVKILENNGFKKSKSTDRYVYIKDKIVVTLEINSEANIEKLIIDLIITNKHNIVF